jgi:hypothetical protein
MNAEKPGTLPSGAARDPSFHIRSFLCAMGLEVIWRIQLSRSLTLAGVPVPLNQTHRIALERRGTKSIKIRTALKTLSRAPARFRIVERFASCSWTDYCTVLNLNPIGYVLLLSTSKIRPVYQHFRAR